MVRSSMALTTPGRQLYEAAADRLEIEGFRLTDLGCFACIGITSPLVRMGWDDIYPKLCISIADQNGVSLASAIEVTTADQVEAVIDSICVLFKLLAN